MSKVISKDSKSLSNRPDAIRKRESRKKIKNEKEEAVTDVLLKLAKT
jgi:hypothetical protein